MHLKRLISLLKRGLSRSANSNNLALVTSPKVISRRGSTSIANINSIPIIKASEKRASEVMHFYHEYLLSMRNIAPRIKSGGHVCFVVGNRTVKGTQLPTDQFTAWAFEQEGFEYLKTYVRDIPNKRMPSRNSPTNKTGVTNSTMVHEYIVVCRKN